MSKRKLRRGVCCAFIALTAGVVVGCGSSGGGPTTPKTSSSTPSASNAAATTTANGAASSAASAVTAAEQAPAAIGITTPLKSKPPTGKVIDYLRCSQPVCAGFEEGLSPAAKALGWKVNYISFGPTPEATVTALEDAVQQRPNGIFVTGVPRVVLQAGLTRAQAAHIPVISGYDLNAVQAPIIANIANGADNNFAPTAGANFIADDSKCQGAVAVYNIPVYPILNYTTNVFSKTLKQLCPSIGISQETAQATDVGTKLPAAVTSTLQANPNIKYLAFAFGDMTLGVPAALKAAGLNVKLIGYGADEPTNVQNVADGQETAETGYGIPYGGWRAMDAFARYFEGMSTAVDTSAPNPGELFTTANAKSVTGWGNMAVAPSAPQQFEKLWHVG